MTKATLKNLVANKARLALTGLSILLGVAFVTGTLIYRDTTADAFDRIFADAYQGIDVVVTGDSQIRSSDGVHFPEELAAEVAAVPGVERAYPTLQASGVQILHDGGTVGRGNAQLGSYVPSEPDARVGVTISEGRAPISPSETVIDAASAETLGLAVGDTVEIITPKTTARSFTVVGIAGFGDDDDLGGASLALFDLPTIQELLGQPGRIDGVLVVAEPGVDVDELIEAVGALLPERAKAQSGAEAADEQAAELQDQLAFVYTFLLVFAMIALFVGTFIIFNTFRIVMAQRTREQALLRAFGASRGQILRAVLLEATAVAIVASGAGIGAGIAVAAILRRGLAAFGVDLPADRLVVGSGTIILALLAGVGVTVMSALVPAVRASMVPPLAAKRPEVATSPSRRLRFRLAFGVLIAATGALLVARSETASDAGVSGRLALVGPGILAIVVAALVLAAPAVGVLTRVIGAPMARRSTAAKLAQRNAGRSPRRTSATAAAIVVATALIALTNVMAASFRAAIHEVLDTGIDADFIATPTDPLSLDGFSAEVTDLVLELEAFESATRMQFGPVLIDGDEDIIASIDEHFADFLNLDSVTGDLPLGSSQVLVVSGPNTDPKTIGETIVVETDDTDRRVFTVAATATGEGLTGTFLSRAAYEELLGAGTDQQVFFGLSPGVSEEQAIVALEGIEDRFPTVTVQSIASFRGETASQVTQVLGLVTALLGLTVVIALVGVANTMALAVHERTREISLLRAVGLSRRDTRRMVKVEAAIVTSFGALLGSGLGIFAGWALLRALREVGFTAFVVPVPLLAGSVLVAAALARLFASWPARTAARLDILRAIDVG